jgi:hypothetical protein
MGHFEQFFDHSNSPSTDLCQFAIPQTSHVLCGQVLVRFVQRSYCGGIKVDHFLVAELGKISFLPT